MPEDLGGEIEDVLRCRVSAAPQDRQRTSSADQIEGGPGTGPEPDRRVEIAQTESLRVSGALDEVDRVLRDGAVDEDPVGPLLELDELIELDHLSRDRGRHAHPLEDLHLLRRRRMSECDLHHEPVALRVRQLVHALGRKVHSLDGTSVLGDAFMPADLDAAE